jgi:energy-coupling factor transporter ATP-binding protein EcfA2
MSLEGVFMAGPAGGIGLSLPERTLSPGEAWFISGPSGSGKSQILRCLAGCSEPPWGRIVRKPGLRTGIAFGRGGLLANHTLLMNLMLPLRYHGQPRAQAQTQALAALDRLHLVEVAHQRPHTLSDPQRKLGSLARVLAWDPDLVVLDEPLDSLEPRDIALALPLLAQWVADPAKAVVVATASAEDFPQLPGRRFTLTHDRMLEV